MKVTFVYSDNCVGNENKFNVGIASLSGYLKKKGYETSLIHISEDINEKVFIKKIEDANPDVLAFSYMKLTFGDVKRFVKWTSNIQIPKIHGGMQPSMAPDETLSVDGIDVICVGEGEQALFRFCDAIKNGKSINDIPSLWIKQIDGTIKKNPIDPLVEELDTLPFLDFGVFDYANLNDAKNLGRLIVQASRGCFYKCTYCGNNYLWKLYPNKKKFLRSFSVDWLIGEIEYGLKLFPHLTNIRFVDDTLTYDTEWFGEFVKKYKERINLPFSGNDRVENITPEIAEMLKDAGCFSIDIGIENGDNNFRREKMKRFMKDEQIISAHHLLREKGIVTRAFSIFGMVDETKQITLNTVKLNAKALPDHFIKAYFTPLMNTEAANIVKEQGLKVKDGATSFFEEPQVELTTMRSCEIEFFYKYFAWLVYIYNYIFRTNSQYLLRLADRIFLSNYFPYRCLNKLYFDEGVLVQLARRFKLYDMLRLPYRFTRKLLTPKTGVDAS